MNTHHNTRAGWRTAYRAARSLAWGTLHCTFPRIIAELAIEARDFTRQEPVLKARRFAALGYYRRGGKRI